MDLTRLGTASIALSGRASCLRGMSTGGSPTTLTNDEHDMKTTDKANESSRLPAFSFPAVKALERMRQSATQSARVATNRLAAMHSGVLASDESHSRDSIA